MLVCRTPETPSPHLSRWAQPSPRVPSPSPPRPPPQLAGDPAVGRQTPLRLSFGGRWVAASVRLLRAQLLWTRVHAFVWTHTLVSPANTIKRPGTRVPRGSHRLTRPSGAGRKSGHPGPRPRSGPKVSLFHVSHFGRCGVASPGGFSLHFPNDRGHWAPSTSLRNCHP